MCVPERMPRYTWLLDSIACGRQVAVVEILRTQWRSFRSAENQVIRQRPSGPRTVGFEHSSKGCAHRDHALAAASFRSAEFSFRKRFGYFDGVAQQIHTFPPESEDLADPHPRKNGELHDCAGRLWQFGEELSHLRRR